MTDALQSQLDQVLALSEKATPGEWAATVGGHVKQVGGVVIVEPNRMRGETIHANADFIATLANLIRQHGPAIRAAVGRGEVVAWRVIYFWGDGKRRGVGPWTDISTQPDPNEPIEYAYASPPATVDVGALRELVEKWRTRGPSSPMTFNIGTATVNKTPYEVGLAERKLIANELAAIIGGAP